MGQFDSVKVFSAKRMSASFPEAVNSPMISRTRTACRHFSPFSRTTCTHHIAGCLGCPGNGWCSCRAHGRRCACRGCKRPACMVLVKNRDGSKQQDCPRPLLAGSVVRYVGEPIVCVIAETPAIGKDALDLIDIDYESLPASTSTGRTVKTDAPQIHDKFPGNIAFDWEDGNPEKTAELMAQAHTVIELDLINNRVIANSMEARCARGAYDTDTGNYVLHTPVRCAFHAGLSGHRSRHRERQAARGVP